MVVDAVPIAVPGDGHGAEDVPSDPAAPATAVAKSPKPELPDADAIRSTSSQPTPEGEAVNLRFDPEGPVGGDMGLFGQRGPDGPVRAGVGGFGRRPEAKKARAQG